MIKETYLKPIQSINLKGKVKYGLKDLKDKFVDNVDGKVEKLKSFGRWVGDVVTKEEAQNFLRSQGLPIKVGALRKVSSKDGGLWKVFGGNPKDQCYYGFFILRNGNDYRILGQEKFSDEDKAKSVLAWYNGIDEELETLEHAQKEKDKILEKENDEYERKMEEGGYEFTPHDYSEDYDDNVIYAEDESSKEGAIVLDKDDYTVIDEGDEIIIAPKDEYDTSDDSTVDYGEWNY